MKVKPRQSQGDHLACALVFLRWSIPATCDSPFSAILVSKSNGGKANSSFLVVLRFLSLLMALCWSMKDNPATYPWRTGEKKVSEDLCCPHGSWQSSSCLCCQHCCTQGAEASWLLSQGEYAQKVFLNPVWGPRMTQAQTLWPEGGCMDSVSILNPES